MTRLRELGIEPRFMEMKPMEYTDTRAAQTNQLGDSEHWSLDGLFNHLLLLENITSELVSPICLDPVYC